MMKKYSAVLAIAAVFIILAFLSPNAAIRSVRVSADYVKEMALILPPVFLLMGLMEVWVPKQKIQTWLGNGSGLRGAALSFLLGTLPTGPLYVAFPMAASLLNKGARIANMVIFLGSWAALKIPQLMVEIKFLGLPFAVVRFFLTLAALAIIGLIMELMLKNHPQKEWSQHPIQTRKQDR